jgi:hypothetical protein
MAFVQLFKVQTLSFSHHLVNIWYILSSSTSTSIVVTREPIMLLLSNTTVFTQYPSCHFHHLSSRQHFRFITMSFISKTNFATGADTVS